MTISAPEYQAWLENPYADRVLLVQATSSTGVEYMSTKGITVSGQYYTPCLQGDFTISSSIGEEYTSSISYSDITIFNPNGERDTWLTRIWDNKSVKVFYGDSSWTDISNDFRQVFSGLIGTLDSRDRFSLNITIRDALQKLNYPILENKLGNYNPTAISPYTNPNQDVIKPIVFGEVFNITPLLTSGILLEYMVNDGDVESIMEVRDNGVPVSFTTVGVPLGSFRLVRTPVGEVTASVQGMKKSVTISTGASSTTYVNNITNIIATIMLNYGKNITTADIDWASFSTTAATSNGAAYIGIYIQDRFNVFTLCNDLAKSAGLVLSTNSLGKIQINPIVVPTSGGEVITESSTILNSLRVSRTVEVKGATKLRYCKNWTVQEGLTTGIPEEHKTEYAKEWREVNSEDATVISNYGLTVEDVAEESFLVDLTQAISIATTKLNLVKTPRRVYSLVCTAKHMQVEVGSTVQIYANRFGMDSGTYGIVMSASPKWLENQIQLEVMV